MTNKQRLISIITNPAFSGRIKTRQRVFLVLYKYSKEILAKHVSGDAISDEEVTEMLEQVEKIDSLRKYEDERRKRRYEQYVVDIRDAIIHRPRIK